MVPELKPQYRKLTQQDFASFYPLFESMISNEIPELVQRSEFFLKGDFSRERIFSSLNYPSIVILGCFVKDQLIGFVWGNAAYAGLGFVSWLMVAGSFREKGIGSRLLYEYEEVVKKLGGHVVELYCFEEMKSFYEKNNYKVIGVRPKGYFGLKQYIFEKIF